MAIVKSCPKCGSKHIVKAGFKVTVGKGRQPMKQCQSCGKSFYANDRIKVKRRVSK